MTLLATVGPLPPGLDELRRRGIAVVTVRTTSAGLLTGVKATSYATALAAIAEAERRGADDAIYLGEGETVLEATMSNIWWRDGDVLVTPALSTGVLPGVTRGAVAALARSAGYRIREGSFTLPALLARRGGVHELGGARDHAGRRRRRPRAAPRRRRAEPAGAARGPDRRLPWIAMADEKLRLGGMALANGVLVHGPTAWACAVRTDDGELKVVAERKRLIGSRVNVPLLRGPARLVESFAVLPRLKRALPEAKLPFEGRGVLVSMVGTAAAVHVVRRSKLSDTAKELVGGLLAVAPAVLSLRSGSLAGYHGAEHIAIGTYEHDAPRAKEHERCGSHLVGPLIAHDGRRQPARLPRPARDAGRPRGSRPRSAPSRRRPRSSAGCSATPSTGSRARSPGRATSSSTGSRRPSRRADQLEVAERRSRPASSSKTRRADPLARGRRCR